MRQHARPKRRRIKREVFRAASIERWKDAQCLRKAERFQGAIYLCGYTLECWLKFRVCVARRRLHMEEDEAKEFAHKLPELLDASGEREAVLRNRDVLLAFHRICGTWSTEIRYSGSVRNRTD